VTRCSTAGFSTTTTNSVAGPSGGARRIAPELRNRLRNSLIEGFGMNVDRMLKSAGSVNEIRHRAKGMGGLYCRFRFLFVWRWTL